MNRKNLFMVMLLAFMMIFTACGGTAPTDEPADEPDGTPDVIQDEVQDEIQDEVQDDIPNNAPVDLTYYVEPDNIAVNVSEYFPAIALYTDNSFEMVVNLYAGMGRITGSYDEIGGSYLFTVLERDFMGFIGDDVDIFTMELMDDGSLLYTGDDIGVTMPGSVFIFSPDVPDSF